MLSRPQTFTTLASPTGTSTPAAPSAVGAKPELRPCLTPALLRMSLCPVPLPGGPWSSQVGSPVSRCSEFPGRRNPARHCTSSDGHWTVNGSCCNHQGCPAPVLWSPSAPGSSSRMEQCPRPPFTATGDPKVREGSPYRSGPTSGTLRLELCPEGRLASLPGWPGFADPRCRGAPGQGRSTHAF